jgi:hypothetical protein
MTLFPKLNLPGLVRVRLGIENSEDDVDTLIQRYNWTQQLSSNSTLLRIYHSSSYPYTFCLQRFEEN